MCLNPKLSQAILASQERSRKPDHSALRRQDFSKGYQIKPRYHRRPALKCYRRIVNSRGARASWTELVGPKVRMGTFPPGARRLL
jgi:hypothetical protein